MVQAVSATDVVGVSPCQVSLLGFFEFRVDGLPVELPRAAERLVAYLALQAAPVSRCRVAAALWPDASEKHSLGCLRSALWRARMARRSLVDPCSHRLGLAPETRIDTVQLTREVRRLADPAEVSVDEVGPDLFGAELLPGWDDDWVILERERFRQLSLSGLDALSRRRLAAGQMLDALEAALRAIALEPLRESAHQALIDAHLAAGNVGEALRRLQSLEALLDREMGIAPSPDLVRRVTSAIASRRGSTSQPPRSLTSRSMRSSQLPTSSSTRSRLSTANDARPASLPGSLTVMRTRSPERSRQAEITMTWASPP